MAQSPVDRDSEFMKSAWGTTSLITDYWSLPSDTPHKLKRQTELHEEIRNDEDYDDWEYGTEPTFGKMI